MYAVSILLKSSALSQSFYFKAFKNADELYKKSRTIIGSNPATVLDVEDDFNARGGFDSVDLAGVSFTDIEEDMKRNGEMQLIQHKATLRTQQIAKGDPTLQLMNSASKLVGVN